jgi:glycosyltransferase involved in cell wall biosynthesis
MLFHLSSAKGCDDGLKSLEIVRDKFPLLKASFFGYPERPKNLPSWIKYIQTPDKDLHNKIYNEAAIFIGTSHSEGWGLTVGEAMICGCAVACTNIEGYNIMAKNEDTALLSEPGDFQVMAENIIRLIDNDKIRYQIAKNGSTNIQKYKWDESYNIFKKTVKIK